MVEGGMKCIRVLLFAFNVLFTLIGIGLIAGGAYVQINLKGYSEIIGGQFSAAAVFLIILGVFIFMIAAFGCCGAYKENYCCIMTFAGILVIIFICEMAAGIAGFIYKDKVDEQISKLMKESIKDGKALDDWNKVQQEFKCCGVNSSSDWETSENATFPDSCCSDGRKSPNCIHYNVGCYTELKEFVKDKIVVIGGIGVGFAVIQIIGILFACCLGRAVKKEYEVV
ncbi:CD63 [Mytilus edulis]|uniref:Tetraspanin n=1 Tax=Mytilus edulis TaxID=6550 RepID=A0A8S3TXL2_MYTED|nr:CD63 [Mytilus edulis]